MREVLFECTKCGEYDNSEEWTQKTIEDIKQNGEYNDNVPSLTKDMVDNKECYYYICPNCGETCYVEDNQIIIYNPKEN